MQVTLVYSPAPRQVREWHLELPAGATVQDALARSPIHHEFPDLAPADMTLGVWGKKTGLDQALRDQDRVEIYRGLQVDPKVARRERFKRQGVKRAGLFASSRVGGKAGY